MFKALVGGTLSHHFHGPTSPKKVQKTRLIAGFLLPKITIRFAHAN